MNNKFYPLSKLTSDFIRFVCFFSFSFYNFDSIQPPIWCCSRVSVMRGQVITPQGLGIIGIRVSVDRDSRFGFTLTRAGGW